MSLEVLSAPANPVVCHPGEDLELGWQLRFSGDVAAGAQLKLRESHEVVGVIQDAVPAGCCVELGLHLQAPKFVANCVQNFVLSSAGDIFGELSIVLSVRSAEPKAHRSIANPLGIIPGNHTRRIYFGRLKNDESPTSNAGIQPVEVVTAKSDDDWALLDRPQVSPQLPAPLKERFGAPQEAFLRFWVNGEEQVVNSGQFPVTTTLAEYLRYHMGLTGTKIGCGEGGCGACTVLLHAPEDTMLLAPNPCMANACLRPLHSMDGWEVTTIEKLGTPKAPHPIQSAFVKHSASQCGMCTPGMIMSIYGHLAKGGSQEPQDLQGCIQGNLCRCTGYRPIHDAMREPVKVTCDVKVRAQPCVPKALHRDGHTWFDCSTLMDAFNVLSEYSAVPHRLVVGNTSTGVVKYYPFHRNDEPSVYINLQKVPELHEIQRGDGNSLTLGAACTLTTLCEELEASAEEHNQLAAVVKHLKLVAHPQVRDVGSWAGNVMIAKTHPDFPSDICLLLSTLNAKLTLMNAKRKTEIVDIISFLSDTKLPRNDEAQIIHSVTIPFPGPNSFLDTFKVMRRHMNTHAEVNAGFLFEFKDATGVDISSARLVVGNIEHKPFVATETSKAMIGKTLDSATISEAIKILSSELKAHIQEPTVPEPPFVVVDPQYRLNLAPQLFGKAALRARLARLGASALTAAELSATEEAVRPASCGAQHFTVDQSTAPVGQPLTKFQGLDQACGTARFVADLPLQPRTLFAVPVLADRIAMLQRIDASACLEVTGVHSFLSAADVKEVGALNDLKPVYPGKIFADAAEKTQHIGQFVGVVLGDSFEAARAGARLVHVDYAEPVAAATTVNAALQKGAVQEVHGPLIVGQEATGPKTLQGKLVSAGQKHFYLETQTTYAYPDSSEGLIFNTACQTLDWAQTQMAKTLNIPKSKITVQNQRLGGAYGGKAMLFTRVCAACGVAVLKTNRPVLLQMDRTADFQAFGARAPFDASWDLSYEESGKITSMKQEVLQNVGTDMLGFSQASSVNCYNIPHAQLHCKGVITDLPVNTWMRAPGDFEGAFIMEAVMEQVARAVGRDPVEVQELNMADGMQKAWQRLKAKVSYEDTLKGVKDFNSKNRYRKKGIYCMGSRYQLEPHAFFERCFVRVYDDGSVLLEHTGLEVGQGMDTKALQACTMALQKIAADFKMDEIELRIPKSTQDFSMKGVLGTFSSVTSETVVSAILDACDKLQKEVQKFMAPGRAWREVIQLAVKGGAQLAQAGITDQAHVNNYTLFSAGCAQVEIDVLTGETQVNSFDVVYDSGRSLNPAVDIGQIEGSLIQALGFSLLEEENRAKDGRLINCGTWDYKVPSGNDIPVRLDVELVPCENPTAPVLGSKASGEPAQLLGGAFFFAVKDAIGYAREEQGLSRNFRMDPPASPSRIQTACSTQL